MNNLKSQARIPLAALRATLATTIDFDTFLAKFGEKDRKTIIRHLATCEEKFGPDAAQRWRRFACVLLTMAPYPAKLAAQQAIQFFIPDGMYRKQVFALHAAGDGVLAVYAVNVLAEAIRAGLLLKPQRGDGETVFRIKESGEHLTIESLDGQTPDPAPIYKAMTGWNRKAICITLPAQASPAQVEAVENLCALAAVEWTSAPQQP